MDGRTDEGRRADRDRQDWGGMMRWPAKMQKTLVERLDRLRLTLGGEGLGR